MKFADVYFKGKRIAKRVKYCESLGSKILGLMFVKSPGGGAFLPDVISPASKGIHMNFVRFELRIIWLDKSYRVIGDQRAKRWRVYDGPGDSKHVLELPIENKTKITKGALLKIKTYESER